MTKWSFSEMTSNNDGKTSSSKTSGFIIVVIGSLCFLLGCIDKMFIDDSIDIITQSVLFTTLGAGLLGVKNIYNKVPENEPKPIEQTPDQPIN